MAETTYSDDIKTLGDRIVGLTLKDAVDLAGYLKDEYGIEPAAAGVAMAAGPSAGGAAEEAEEQTEFDVVLTDAGPNKIKVIKVVKDATGLGLKEAKDLVDSLPKPVKTALPKEEADKLVEQIKEVGGVVELK